MISEKPYKKPYGSAFARVEFIDNKDIRKKRILDLGCGTGWFEIYALKKGVERIVGIDRSENSVKIAKRYVKDKKATFLNGEITDLGFRSESFNNVYCWEVIEHLPKTDEHLLFSEVNRVLKPGGKFYLSTPYDSFFSKVSDPAHLLFAHRHYSLESLTRLGENYRLKVTKTWVRGGWYWIIYTLNMYASKWLFKREPFFNEFFAKLATREYKHPRGFITIFVKYEKEK